MMTCLSQPCLTVGTNQSSPTASYASVKEELYTREDGMPCERECASLVQCLLSRESITHTDIRGMGTEDLQTTLRSFT